MQLDFKHNVTKKKGNSYFIYARLEKKKILHRKIVLNISGIKRPSHPKKKDSCIFLDYSSQIKLFLASITKIILPHFQLSSY